MKELSIEEKAKAYDKALKVLHKYDSANIMFSQSLKEEMFPELKESEDEKIRKAIKYGLDHVFTNNTTIFEVTKEQCLTWLEKQGEHANFRNKIQIGDKVTRNRDGVLVNLSQLKRVAKPAEKQSTNMGISEAIKQKLEDNLNKALEKETPESCNEFLDKQGEQNPVEPQQDMLSQEKYTKAVDECIYGEQKPVWSEENEVKDNWEYIQDFIKKLGHFPKDSDELDVLINYVLSKKQKPAWSEEDEEIHRKCICAMRASACGFPEEEKFVEQVDNWLKSIKERYTWKPSDEQIKALNYVVNIMASSERPTENDLYYNILKSLRQQLKKHYL